MILNLDLGSMLKEIGIDEDKREKGIVATTTSLDEIKSILTSHGLKVNGVYHPEKLVAAKPWTLYIPLDKDRVIVAEIPIQSDNPEGDASKHY